MRFGARKHALEMMTKFDVKYDSDKDCMVVTDLTSGDYATSKNTCSERSITSYSLYDKNENFLIHAEVQNYISEFDGGIDNALVKKLIVKEAWVAHPTIPNNWPRLSEDDARISRIGEFIIADNSEFPQGDGLPCLELIVDFGPEKTYTELRHYD